MVANLPEATEAVRGIIASRYPQVSRAFIFGSFAEDAPSLESDLDVLVELNDAMGLRFISMIQEIEKAAGVAVDVITVRQAHDLEAKFGYDILGKAILIYERAQD
ncbi:MAG: nucleotidyltransferase domain-containing protein [Dethiobacter sp.]|nr:nucleotidyltransferase domain-containing protein [Dethiobacter sp.]